MISVEEALRRVLALGAPLPAETVALRHAAGRVLREAPPAPRDQPPFDAAAMDGYAVAGEVRPGVRFRVTGESRAGARHGGALSAGEALRIFTGAPLPDGATRVIIQEDVTRDGDVITLGDRLDEGRHIRQAGGDFRRGAVLEGPRRLRPVDLALLAAMNVAALRVTRRPVVAIVATGDELVMPGDSPGPDQIVASNIFALAALAEAEGAEARILPIARDRPEALAQVLGLATGADLVVTVGGASVGDHDLVGAVAQGMGFDRAFYRVAMRPGKPLMAGRLGGAAMLGLPGNPVSAIVCGMLFLQPLIRVMLGLGAAPLVPMRARLAQALGANGPRAHYMRARLVPGADLPLIDPFPDQDSARLRLLTEADALLVRPVGDPARAAGEEMDYLPL